MVRAAVHTALLFATRGRGDDSGKQIITPRVDPGCYRASPAEPEVRRVVSEHFDPVFYLDRNPDVREAGILPLDHFLLSGWKERRNPTSNFETGYYIDANPDVVAAGLNPFYHFLTAGLVEGRAGRRPNGVLRSIVERATPPREEAKHWPSFSHIPTLGDSALSEALNDFLPDQCSGLVLSFGHNSHLDVSGGIENSISYEETMFVSAGYAYIYLFPTYPLPMMSDDADIGCFAFGMSVNGIAIGHTSAAQLVTALSQRKSARCAAIYIVLHSLLGHSPEVVQTIAQALGVSSTSLWLHDFFTICSNYALLRNDATFCNAPPIDSGACTICVYGCERPRHTQRLSALFEALQPNVLAPSESALDFWRLRSAYVYRAASIVPHARISIDDHASPRPPATENPLKVAFIGAAAVHKGWLAYVELVLRVGWMSEYEFLHLGVAQPSLPSAPQITEVEVRVTPDQRDAMIDALKTERVDIAINWSLCYETFSFTTYEAIAAGCYIVARRGTGNVAAALTEYGQGILLGGDDELFNVFGSRKIIDLFRAAQARGLATGTLVRAALSVGSLTGTI